MPMSQTKIILSKFSFLRQRLFCPKVPISDKDHFVQMSLSQTKIVLSKCPYIIQRLSWSNTAVSDKDYFVQMSLFHTKTILSKSSYLSQRLFCPIVPISCKIILSKYRCLKQRLFCPSFRQRLFCLNVHDSDKDYFLEMSLSQTNIILFKCLRRRLFLFSSHLVTSFIVHQLHFLDDGVR